MYKIVRWQKSGGQRVIRRNLTLEEARRHCRREVTYKKDKNGNVLWFDGYIEQQGGDDK